MIPAQAVEAAAKEREELTRADGYRRGYRDGLIDRKQVLPRVLDAVLDISNIRMTSEHGDPAFVAGWEAALEEVRARIEESVGGSEDE